MFQYLVPYTWTNVHLCRPYHTVPGASIEPASTVFVVEFAGLPKPIDARRTLFQELPSTASVTDWLVFHFLPVAAIRAAAEANTQQHRARPSAVRTFVRIRAHRFIPQ